MNKTFLILIFLAVTASAEVKYTDFPLSTTWVEEDFFTQQEKYCEADSIYGDILQDDLEDAKDNNTNQDHATKETLAD